MGTKTRQVKIILNGPGKVGTRFMELLWSKARRIREATGFEVLLVAVKSRRSIIYKPEGIAREDLGYLADLGKSKTLLHLDGSLEKEHRLSRSYLDVLRDIAKEGPGILLEATPTDLVNGEPGLSHIRQALEEGLSVVSLAKGPLVLAFKELKDLAREKRVHLKYSGAVAAALPTVDTATYAMAGSDIYEIQGVLNGTSNFILNHMAQGRSFEEALNMAKETGVAERDPSLDVKGLDSAAKLIIIANTIWDLGLGLSDVEIHGIENLSSHEVQDSWRKGYPMRLIAKAVNWELKHPYISGEAKVDLSVGPEKVPLTDPLGILDGTKKALTLRSREMGQITVFGGASDVLGAAASALKDVVHILADIGKAVQ